MLNERIDQLDKYAYELENLKIQMSKLMNENNKINTENQKLKDQIVMLNEANQRVKNNIYLLSQLKDDLDFTLDQDRRIKSHLERKDVIYGSIGKSKFFINSTNVTTNENKRFSPGKMSPQYEDF